MKRLSALVLDGQEFSQNFLLNTGIRQDRCNHVWPTVWPYMVVRDVAREKKQLRKSTSELVRNHGIFGQ